MVVDDDLRALERETMDKFAAGDLEAALHAAAEAVELAERRCGPRDLRTALALHLAGAVRRADEAWAEAEECYVRALAIRRDVLGPEHAAVAATLHEMALVEHGRGDLEAAIGSCASALEIQTAQLGPDAPRSIQTRRDLAVLERQRAAAEGAAAAFARYQEGCATRDAGDLAGAVAAFGDATRRNREALGDTHRDVASCLNALGQAYETLGQISEAHAALREALYIGNADAGATPAQRSVALGSLASVELKRERVGAAERLALEAVALLGDDDEELPGALQTLGRVQVTSGALAGGERSLRRALVVLGEPLDRNRDTALKAAAVLGNLGALAYDAGRYADAKDSYARALALKRAAVGEEDQSYAVTSTNLAILLTELGDHHRARQLLEQAVNTFDREFGEDHRRTRHTRMTLAQVDESLGDRRRARLEWEALLKSYADDPEASALDLAHVRRRLGMARADAGEMEEATRLLQAALDGVAAAYGEDHRQIPVFRQTLATAQIEQGDLEAAGEQLSRSYERLAADDVPDRSAMHGCLVLMASLEFGRDPFRAQELLDEAVAGETLLAEEIFAAVGDEHRMRHAEGFEIVLGLYLALVERAFADSVDAQWAVADLVLRRKGLVRDVLLLERAAAGTAPDPTTRSRLLELARLRSEVARVSLEGPRYGARSDSERELEQLRRRRDELQEALLPALGTRQAITEIVAADARRVAAALPAGSVLLEYVRTPALTLAGRDEERAAYHAVVVRRGEPPVVLRLGDADAIDAATEAYLREITTEPELRSDADAVTRLGADVRRLVVDPALTIDVDGLTLLVAPAGRLWAVPFDALPDDRGGWLIDDCQVRYVASGRWITATREERSLRTGSPVVVADPDFDLSGRDVQEEPVFLDDGLFSIAVTKDAPDMEVGLERLPDTRREAAIVGRLLGVEPVLDCEATKPRVQAVQAPAILHLATHAVFLEADDVHGLQLQRMLSAQTQNLGEMMETSIRAVTRAANRLLRSMGEGTDEPELELDDPELELEPDPFEAELENPLLRSGLALAGVNTWLRRGSVHVDADNGLLSAVDVAAMDLVGTELVVLPACNTAGGVVDHPDGVVGLRRAFAIAGARSLVLSLWSLPDTDETVEMVEQFYRRVTMGDACGPALHEAKLLLRRRGLDPFFWGALILEGDPGGLSRR